MQVSKEFLIEAVGLSILVALLLISMQLFQRAAKISTLIEKEQMTQISELEEYEIVKFEGMVVDGITAINYIKRMTGVYELSVNIITEKGEFMISELEECAELRNINSDKYMQPLAKYCCGLIRDENKVITKIKIEVIKEGE